MVRQSGSSEVARVLGIRVAYIAYHIWLPRNFIIFEVTDKVCLVESSSSSCRNRLDTIDDVDPGGP